MVSMETLQLFNRQQTVGKKDKTEDSYANSCVAGREFMVSMDGDSAVVQQATNRWQKRENRRFIC
jgi:hypothetical protein